LRAVRITALCEQGAACEADFEQILSPEQQRLERVRNGIVACHVQAYTSTMNSTDQSNAGRNALNDPVALADRLAHEFAATAVERDRRGGTPKAERDAIRASGILAMSIPVELGGWGASWTTTLHAVRTIARSDGSIAHVFGFQHLLLATVRLFGTPKQFADLARSTVANRWFWGNAVNPLDERTTIAPCGEPNSRVLHGEKSFCSGSHDADMLVVSARDAARDSLVIAAIPAQRCGITVRDDWNNMGQRQTDSGTVSFNDVRVAEDEILSDPGPLGNIFATLRPLIAQLSLCNVYLGIAEGAFGAARHVIRQRSRAWHASSVSRVEDDPYVLSTLGDLSVALESARQVTDAAAARLDRSWDRGMQLTESERGECAWSIAIAKVVTTQSGLEVTNRIFEAAGARATTAPLGLDRYWRDLRTHTLHDPVDYKRRELGRNALTGEWPQPSFYS
jgi:alkylation response protein AidB-like acyl-CoA dehydrogenase